ncbi:MAG TPA: acetyltransferase [Candidatus Omnitrophota bacterium]|nr:acetyltransferase [Candidatus Omnitrophota bacterium]HRZ15286.1 acetyltransferase [Candidatus Omnitrophota bacterium]
MKKVVLIGGGTHCKVVLEAIRLSRSLSVQGILDKKDKIGSRISGVAFIGDDTCLRACRKKGIRLGLITVGSVGDPALRIRLARRAADAGFAFPTVIHPAAVVSPQATLGAGTFVAAGAVVGPGTITGEHCIINTGALIDHDCRIGAFVHCAPGSVLSGAVTVGSNTHIGAGAVCIQELTVGKDCVIGAGSVVVDDIKDGVVAFGNPCRERKKNGA